MPKQPKQSPYDFKKAFEIVRTANLEDLGKWRVVVEAYKKRGEENASNEKASGTSAENTEVTTNEDLSGVNAYTVIKTTGHTEDTLLISAVQSDLIQTFVSCFREFHIIRFKAHFLGLAEIPDKVMKSIKITGDDMFNICHENPQKLLEILSEKSAAVVAWSANSVIKDSRGAFFNEKTNPYNKTDYGTLLLHNCVRNMFQHNHGQFRQEDLDRESEALPKEWMDSKGAHVKINDVLNVGDSIELNWFLIEDLIFTITNIIKAAQI